MIRLLILVFALVFVIGGGVAGLVHFAVIPDFSGGMIANLVGVQGQPPGAAKEEDAAPAPRVDPIFMQVEPMLIPVIQDGELKRNVYIALRLEVTPDNKETVRLAMSRLHDVYMRALYDLVPEQYERRDTLDLAKIRDRLMVLTDRVVGPDKVEDIIFLSVFNR
jgi:flagellar basal body-associated protein FliL